MNIQNKAPHEAPRRIQVDKRDNVAIIVNVLGLPAGTEFPDGLVLNHLVPNGHKVALADIPDGGNVVRYGEVIGTAKGNIARGDWINENNVGMGTAPPLEALEMATRPPPPPAALTGHTFEGYRNADGTVGTKNILAVSTSVQCVAGTMEYALKRIKAELLPKYPNVDDVVVLTHAYGCGVAINAPQAVVPIRTLQNLAKNPNFGGDVLVIGLGCEKLVPERLFEGGTGEAMRMQDHEGFGANIAAILERVESRLKILNERRRETVPASELIVGMQCGGSDAFSGLTANPALGFCADLLVAAGATVMFSEVTEVRDAIHLLTPRAATREVADALVAEMRWYDNYLDNGGVDRGANTTPGNKKGGLSNIIEKSLGSVAKSGSSAINAVLKPGEKVRSRGLVFAATPASDFVCGTLQLASGMNLHVFTTGRGTPYGLAAVPVIKVATRTDLAQRWADLIDLDAGPIATGEKTIEQVGWELFHLMLDVASGRKQVWADKWGLHNDLTLFNPAPVT